MYDLKNPLKVVNSPEGCTLALTACSSCNNNGYCEPYLDKESVCVCDVGYSGDDCSACKYFCCNIFKKKYFLLSDESNLSCIRLFRTTL